MRKVFSFMRKLERDPAVLSASLFMMHPYVSAERMGWAAHVSTDGDRERASAHVDAIADRAWEQRDVPYQRTFTVGEAIDRLPKRTWAPISFVDMDDIVGAGAPGGNTRILSGLLERNVRAYVPVHDPALAKETWDAPIGSRKSLRLRGTPGYGSPEIDLDATIGARAQTISGRTVRLDVGAVRIAVTENPPLPIHPGFWRSLDLSPRDATVIVQKNFFHYRMFYAVTSFEHVLVVSDGATSLRRIFRYACEDHQDWRAYDRQVRG
jgi:microcystin degradation protein MlrC